MNADPTERPPQGTPPESEQDDSDTGATPRLPSADEIEIPAAWQVEADDPAGDDAAVAEAGGADQRAPYQSIGGRVARRAGDLMFLLDRILLVVAIGGPVLILGYQSFEWLRTAHWPALPVGQVLLWLEAHPGAALAAGQWPGLHRAVSWILAMPFSLFLFAAGLLLHLLSGLIFARTPRE